MAHGGSSNNKHIVYNRAYGRKEELSCDVEENLRRNNAMLTLKQKHFQMFALMYMHGYSKIDHIVLIRFRAYHTTFGDRGSFIQG